MKPEICKIWVDALRSGKYKQARHALHTKEGGMCCLGVLSDLYIKETGKGEWAPEFPTDRDGFSGYNQQLVIEGRANGVVAYPTKEVLDWAGMKTPSGRLSDYDTSADSLASRNDHGATFEEIADAIEENCEIL